jgi:hypothetical protein
MIRTKLTYANVVATLALIVAVAGGSTAIAISSKQKISGKLIKPGTITTKQLKDGSVTGPKLATIDRIAATGPAIVGEKADCPQGSKLISGGAVAFGSTDGITRSDPSDVSETWRGASAAGQSTVIAMCLRSTPGK